jgi:hypothetical protein
MAKVINVYKGRTNKVSVSLGVDISGDTFISEIREQAHSDSPLIAAWNVAFLTNGVDGELVLTLDDSVTALIEKTQGYMDVKRVVGGEALSAFDGPLDVIFKDSVTV